MSANSDLIDRKIENLFSYWESLDQSKVLPEDSFKKLRQKVRGDILKVLATGIEDKGRIRHVLNAQEIYEQLNKNKSKDSDDFITKANVYFHISELEKLDGIRIVDAIPIRGKKRAMTYYSRTAKMFVLSPPADKSEYPIIYDQDFHKLLQRLNPDVPVTEINSKIAMLKNLDDFTFDKILDWFSEHNEMLQEVNLENAELFEFLSLLYRVNETVYQGLGEIAKLLKFEK